MVVERQFRLRVYCRIFIIAYAISIALCSSFVFAAEKKAASRPARYRVFALKCISAEQGKKYLAEAKIGTVSQLPNSNTLLVTAQPRELIKASAILKLVDSNEPFVIKTIFSAAEFENLPSNEQIAAEVGDISIGSFSNPPTGSAARAIIDIHENEVIAIAPAEQIERMTSAIERLQKAKTHADEPTELDKSVEPNQPPEFKPEEIAEAETVETKIAKTEPKEEAAPEEPAEQDESDELFGKLLSSLDEAEKKAIEQPRELPEPNEPAAVATAPEAKEPNEPSTADSEQVPIKPVVAAEPAEQPQEPNLPAVVKDSEPKDVAEKPEAEPEPPVEQEPVKTERVEEVVEPNVAWRSYKPEPTLLAEEELELNLPETLKIMDLLDLVGKYLHLDYMYNVADLKDQEVALKVQGPIKVKELYPLVESVLKFKGFVMTRKGNLVTVVPKDKVFEIDPALMDAEKGKVAYGDVIITRIFRLKHIDTADAQNLLTGMSLGVKITSIPATKTLIVAGYAYRMERIEELLAMVDKLGEAKKFRFRQLKYTMAETLAPKIKTLAEQLGTISISIEAPKPEERKPPTQARTPRGRPAPKPTTRPTAKPPQKTEEPTVYIEADERTNRILMIGLEKQLAIVEDLIDTLDVKQQDLRTLRLYEIQYVGAEDVMEKLEELGIISGGQETTRGTTRTTTTRTTQTGRRPPTTAKPPTTTGEAPAALVEEPQVVVVESTNSLLVNATDEQHIRIATIISYVDSEPEQAAINYIVYPLENQDPEDLAGVLNQLIQETVETKAGKDDKITRTTTVKKTEENIIIIPDLKTYSLIVYASKRNQQWISSLIRQLDEYRPQVLLDVTLVEITKNEQFTYDLSLLTKYPTIPLVGTEGDIANIVSPPPSRRIWEAKATSGAGGRAFYADEHIQAVLNIMHEKGYGRILAKPKLLVNDNENGIIKTEEQQTIVAPETTVIPGTAGGAPTAATSIKTETYIAGITLDIQPHISKGDQLRLQISLNRTDFRLKDDYKLTTPDGDLTGPTPPDLLTSDVTTVVTVPDNTTIILGGLEKLKQSKGGTKVPILGDIPIIGGLFRNTSNIDDQSRLYVFVKAHILRPGEELIGKSDIELVSTKNKATFEKHEKEMQEYEDWPGFKPEPMDPLKVLEAD